MCTKGICSVAGTTEHNKTAKRHINRTNSSFDIKKQHLLIFCLKTYLFRNCAFPEIYMSLILNE